MNQKISPNSKKVCPYCFNTFIPNPKVGDRQKCCGSESCKLQRKRDADRQWRKKNPEYFKNRYKSHLKPWLEKHPGYLKQYRKKTRETIRNKIDIQDELTSLKDYTLYHLLNDIQDKLSLKITSEYHILTELSDIQDELKYYKANLHKEYP